MMKNTIQMLVRALHDAFATRAGEGTWVSHYEFVPFTTPAPGLLASSTPDEAVNATSYVRELAGAERESDRELEEFLAAERERSSAKSSSGRAA
jgi:hypothetical protein